MRSRLHLLRLAAFVATLGAAAATQAQAWLADRDRAQGRGIRVGDFELHPGIGSEIGYDTNVFLSDGNEQDSAVLRLAPHFFVSTLTDERAAVGGGPPPKLQFRSGISGTLKHYFATAQGTDVGVGQDMRVVLFPERTFTLELFEEYTRSIDPFVDPAGPTPTGAADYGRDQLALGTKLGLQSRGGLLKGGLGYRLDLDHFEGSEFQGNRSRRHTLSAESVYEFLPKTGVFWNGTLGFHGYVNDAEPLARRNDATLVATRTGLHGGLTDKVGFTLGVGYGAGFFDGEGDYENVIGQVEGRYRPTPSTLWTLGYDREYRTAFQGNYARIDRPRTSLQVLFGGTVLVVGKVEVTFTDFGDDPLDGTADARNDILVLTNLQGEYRFTDWLAATAELGYLRNFSDYVFATLTDGAQYDQLQAWLGLRAFL